MPTYKNSKTQSKNGGRRRKSTMRKLRRGRKSRKVMRGGDDASLQAAIMKNEGAIDIVNAYNFNVGTVTKKNLIDAGPAAKLKLKTLGIDLDQF